ncbi:Periplasmic beta-glucosidase [Hypsibius exemplaris]|uniref:beta-glucosidase n=1 Tax=Hypsibius exemplaris TaxID=2072580 RepID=A0A9X6RMT8_HYPEX|nr:Periplasmic beta-glucosidase [Hypsibius exemplaris]
MKTAFEVYLRTPYRKLTLIKTGVGTEILAAITMRSFVAALVVVTTLLLGERCLARQPSNSRLSEAEIERQIETLLSQMTLEEKLGQLQQLHGIKDSGMHRPGQLEKVEKGLAGSFYHVRGARNVNVLHNATLQSRLKIPLLLAFDVIHGYRTLFPIPLGEAASWDLKAAERAASIAAAEARSAGVHWTFAPMVDISRDPRWGRVMEGSGEDVHLGVELAKARIRGFQGADYSQKDKVLACAKHLVGYGAAEGGRDYNTVDMSERRLRETYLPPFKAAVDAGVGSFMTAFNDLNGMPATANKFILRDILRGEWEFDGLVVSDHNSVEEMINHGLAADKSEAARLALNAGTDMEMFSGTYLENGAKLVETGKVATETINNAVRNVLRIKFRLGLFENPNAPVSAEQEQATLKKPEFLKAAREIAAKSFVLLKNENETLPIDLNKTKRLAVIGALADDKPNTLDWWSGDAHAEDSITILQGLRDFVAAANANLTSPATVTFSKGCESTCDSDKDFPAARIVAAAADFVVIVVGEIREVSGEAGSLSNIDLSGRQLDLVKEIAATGKPYVVVLKNGRPLTITWLAENAPAILVTWHAGTMGGPAVADVLFGAVVNPQWKTPHEFPRSLGQIPLNYDYKNTGRPFNASAPLRDTSRYMDAPNTPLYPFGFGLSYTTFRIDELNLSSERVQNGESVRVSVQVQNTGNRAGEEVVQLYLRDVYAAITRPMRQLKGFQKVALEAGEKRQVEFVVLPEDMSFLDEAWKMTVEAGEFEVFVGNSVNAVMGKFTVEGSTSTAAPTGATTVVTSTQASSAQKNVARLALYLVFTLLALN